MNRLVENIINNAYEKTDWLTEDGSPYEFMKVELESFTGILGREMGVEDSEWVEARLWKD